jgi:DNA transformation protein
MAVTNDYLQYVLEQLAGLGHVVTRRMFGAVGLYHDGRFFGLISADTVYFKVNDANRPDYESRGADQFRPFPDKPHLSMTYYSVPADTLEDADECVVWARKSLSAAAIPRRAAAGRKPAARRKPVGPLTRKRGR